jgi:hypothetical protein
LARNSSLAVELGLFLRVPVVVNRDGSSPQSRQARSRSSDGRRCWIASAPANSPSIGVRAAPRVSVAWPTGSTAAHRRQMGRRVPSRISIAAADELSASLWLSGQTRRPVLRTGGAKRNSHAASRTRIRCSRSPRSHGSLGTLGPVHYIAHNVLRRSTADSGGGVAAIEPDTGGPVRARRTSAGRRRSPG